MSRSLVRLGALAATLLLACVTARADRDSDLAAVSAAVQVRSDEMIATHVDRPFPRPAPDPASPALGNAAYALSALWMNVDVANASQLLVDVRDSAFADEYWAMGQITRSYELFSCDSAFRPGRLTPAAEEAIEDVLRRHLEAHSRLAEASEPWIIDGSENHDVMRRSVNLLGSAILAADPARAALPLPDGFTPAEHHAAWSAFFASYLQERARKGLFVERGSPTYSKYTLQSIFNIRDFAAAPEVRALAGRLLDLYFADASHEVLDGVRGGAKSRSYHDTSSAMGTSDSLRAYMHLLAGSPAILPLTQHPSSLCAATSTYRLPREILDLILHPEDKGAYSYLSRPPGRGTRTVIPPPIDTLHYSAEFPSDVLSTTLATPGYIAGAHCVDPSATYMQIHSQNRWFGAILSGSANSRVYAQCVPTQQGNRTAYDEMTGIGEGDTLIVQRLASGSGGPMRVYFSSDLVIEELWGCVFVRDPAGTAYIAVRPGQGGYWWEAADPTFPNGTWMQLADGDSPVIIQLGLAADYADFAAFQTRLNDNLPNWIAPAEMRYTPLRGREITWFTNGVLPQIGGVTVDLAPPKVFDSPFLSWDFDSLAGTVTSTQGYGGRTRSIDLSMPVTGPGRLVLEAESGALAAPMSLGEDVAASGRSFAHVPDANGAGGDVRFAFTVLSPGEWTLWARVYWLDGGANSLFESVDGEPARVLGNGPATGAWHWVRGATRVLTAGLHELVIASREDGSRLDQIVLIADGTDVPPDAVERGLSDADADGVPDAWLQSRFGHALGEAADLSRAGDDADGDSETTLGEHRAGTDPLDARDSLLIFIDKPAGAPSIRFGTRVAAGAQCPPPSRRYAVMRSAASAGPWAPAPGLGDLAAGSPVDAPLPPGSTTEFYVVDATIR